MKTLELLPKIKKMFPEFKYEFLATSNGSQGIIFVNPDQTPDTQTQQELSDVLNEFEIKLEVIERREMISIQKECLELAELIRIDYGTTSISVEYKDKNYHVDFAKDVCLIQPAVDFPDFYNLLHESWRALKYA